MAFKYLWSAVMLEEKSWMMYFLSFTKLALWLKVEGRSGRMYAWGTSLAKRLLSVTILLLLMAIMFFSCHAWNWHALAQYVHSPKSLGHAHHDFHSSTSCKKVKFQQELWLNLSQLVGLYLSNRVLFLWFTDSS